MATINHSHTNSKDKVNLQDFLDYSVQHYDGLGRVLSSALKDPLPTKVKKY